MNKSIPTSSQVEFISVTPLNPLISRCEIKVLYTGLNRNRTFISRDTANNMAKSLPGTPIVGEFLSEDFGDHGSENLVIDDNGLRFVKSTVPYGFIPMDAKIWWQNFLDKDGVEREYLLTEGYLWTGRYPESQISVTRGNGQSMELDRESLAGEWTKDINTEQEYFNINEALFSALCILGENVEPCFEGASVGKPQTLYCLDKDNFKSQFNEFMLDLKDALNIEGGKSMENLDNNQEPVVPVVPEPEDAEFAKKKKDEEEEKNKDNAPQKDDSKSKEDKKSQEDGEEKDPAKKEEKPAKKEEEAPAKKEDAPTKEDDEEDKKKKKKAKYNLEEVVEYVELSKEHLALQQEYAKLQGELEAIKPVMEKYAAEEQAREAQAKEEMIAKFGMLNEEDLVEVKENMSNFTLDEIEAKLCVIAVRKKVNFNLDDTDNSDKSVEKPVTTYNVSNTASDSTPAWIKAVERRSKNK